MPSWPSRLLHTSQATNASQPTEAGPNCFTKDETEIDVPTPASSRHGVRASRNPSESPRQGRSHSHPLTTLFDQTKKVDGRHRNESNLSSLALKHNPIAKPIDVTSGKASSVSPKALKLKDQDKELIAGRCATCDSAVKWPKHLSVFRCTICLMVNDLQPMEDQSQRQLPKEHSGDRRCPGHISFDAC